MKCDRKEKTEQVNRNENDESTTEEVVAHSLKEIFSSKAHFVATVKQFVKFGFVGVMNVGIALGVYYICISNGIDKFMGNTLGYALGTVNAYLWNAFWVFKGNRQGFIKTLPKFLTTYISTYLLSMLLLYLFVDLGGMNEYLAPIVNTFITTFINFFLSKFWTFKR